MLPQFEQTAMYNAFNFIVGSSGPLVGSRLPLGNFVNSTVATVKIALFQCPSDRDMPYTPGAPYFPQTRGNYGVNWGNTRYDQGLQTTNFPPGTTRGMPFPLDKACRLADFVDGTSTSVIMAEILQGSGIDIRGLESISVERHHFPWKGTTLGDQWSSTVWLRRESTAGFGEGIGGRVSELAFDWAGPQPGLSRALYPLGTTIEHASQTSRPKRSARHAEHRGHCDDGRKSSAGVF
jgi:hypothetical protein